MPFNWRPGSAGEREQKEAKVILAFVSIIALVCLALIFFIPSQYRDAVKETTTFLNIVGAALVAGSVVPVALATRAGNGVQGHLLAWIFSLGLGLFLAGAQGL